MADNDYDYDENDEPADDEPEGEAAAESEAAADPEVAAKARSEVMEAESLSPSAKDNLRRQLEEEMERFLAAGGRIKEVPPDPDAEPSH
ncbi:MAG: hypothetical protein VW625_08360 [Perlucidibaca sp.]